MAKKKTLRRRKPKSRLRRRRRTLIRKKKLRGGDDLWNRACQAIATNDGKTDEHFLNACSKHFEGNYSRGYIEENYGTEDQREKYRKLNAWILLHSDDEDD